MLHKGALVAVPGYLGAPQPWSPGVTCNRGKVKKNVYILFLHLLDSLLQKVQLTNRREIERKKMRISLSVKLDPPPSVMENRN